MTGWIKNIMSTEQKKSDFRPEEHGVGLVERTMVMRFSWNLKESINRKKKITSCSATGSHGISEKLLLFPPHDDVTRQHGGFGRGEPFSIECHKTKTKPFTYQLGSVLGQSHANRSKTKTKTKLLLLTFN